jgi:flagellar M-ring protein FliF
MDQIVKLFRSLSWRQKLTIALTAVVAGVAIFGFSHWRKESDFRPLYKSLSPEDAGAVVEKLREMNVEYRVADNGGAVLAPSARVAELRLEMAHAGLPRTGRIGFELFDKTNLGVTEFAEQVNYRRALEGELERSVTGIAAVEQARVHITFPKDSVFLEARSPAKASVMVRLRPGARLEAPQVAAITHLLASAVDGLAPEAVSVLDMQGNLLSRPRLNLAPGSEEPSEAMLDFQRQIERDLLRKINTTLEPLLGAERFRAGVSVECDFTSGEQSEEIFDPTRSVMLTSQKTEDAPINLASAGVPGTASSLPRPAPRSSAVTGGLSRRTENISYQSSRTVRKTVLPQGSVKRLSVALLLDQDMRWEGQGSAAKRVLLPPSPEKLKAVRDLVAGIVSLNPDRGDQIVVETLAFEATMKTQPPPAPAKPAAPGSPWSWNLPVDQRLVILAGAAAALLLALGAAGWWIYRRRRRRKPAAAGAEPGSHQLEDAAAKAALAAKDADDTFKAQMNVHMSRQEQLEAEILAKMKLPIPKTEKAEVLSKQLRTMAVKDTAIPVEVLRRWIAER